MKKFIIMLLVASVIVISAVEINVVNASATIIPAKPCLGYHTSAPPPGDLLLPPDDEYPQMTITIAL